jgi:hypothetical protein
MPRKGDASLVSPVEVYDYLAERGASHDQALGILANIQGESGFNPTAVGDSGASIGMFQHQGARRRGLEAYGDTPMDWRQQVDYALSEPEGLAYMGKDFASPAAAATWWTRNFERPANPDRDSATRIRFIPGLISQVGDRASDSWPRYFERPANPDRDSTRGVIGIPALDDSVVKADASARTGVGEPATGSLSRWFGRPANPDRDSATSVGSIPDRYVNMALNVAMPTAKDPGIGERALNFIVPAARASDVPVGQEDPDLAAIMDSMVASQGGKPAQPAAPNPELEAILSALVASKAPAQKAAAYDPNVPGSKYDPTEGMSDTEITIARLQSGVRNTVRGAGQTLGDVSTAVGAGLDTIAPGTTDTLGRWSDAIGLRENLPTAEDVAEARRIDAALTSTTGGYLTQGLGEAIPYGPFGIGRGILGLAATGGAMGALGQRESASEQAQNALAGIVLGGTLGGVIGAGRGAWRAGKWGADKIRGRGQVGAGPDLPPAPAQEIQPGAAPDAPVPPGVPESTIGAGMARAYDAASRQVRRFTPGARDRRLGDELRFLADDPNTLMFELPAGPTITGARPTVADISGDAGIARFQDYARNTPWLSGPVQARLAENNAARVNALQEIAGTPRARMDAEVARRTAAEEAYRISDPQVAPIPENLRSLLSTPDMAAAVKEAERAAANRREPFGITFDENGVPVQISGRALHDLDMIIDGMLKDPMGGWGGVKGRILRNTRAELARESEAAVPDLGAANAGYARDSAPLNRMDVGDYLLRKGTSTTEDLRGMRRISAHKIGGILEDTGVPRNWSGRKGGYENSLERIFAEDPANLARLRAIREEAMREAATKADVGTNSATYQRLQMRNQAMARAGAMAEATVGRVPVVGNLLVQGAKSRAASKQYKLDEALVRALLDPVEANRLMKLSAPRGPIPPRQ